MARRLAVVDGNSLGFAAQNATKLSAGEFETTAIFGFLRSLSTVLREHRGYTPIVLWDGDTWRKSMFPEYKANRDEKKNRKMAEMRAAYRKQRPYIGKMLVALGVAQVIAPKHEADDLAGEFVRRRRKDDRIMLISGDKDWLQLVGEGVVWSDPIRGRLCNEHTFHEFTGYETPQAFLEGKALQGDTGDNIPGVGGVGEKRAVELLNTFKSVDAFLSLDDAEREKQWTSYHGKSLPKVLREFPSDETKVEAFRRNLVLMDLIRSPAVPFEGNRIVKLDFDEERFKALCAEFSFHSILRDYGKWVAPFVR